MLELELEAARQFALERHGTQPYGNRRYVFHLDDVVQTLLEAGCSPTEQRAGYLHDVLEDTGTTPEELERRFGAQVLTLVEAVTGRGQTRRERRADKLRKLSQEPGAINLALADRYCNMRQSFLDDNQSLLRMYLQELPEYEALFERGHPVLRKKLRALLMEAA